MSLIFFDYAPAISLLCIGEDGDDDIEGENEDMTLN